MLGRFCIQDGKTVGNDSFTRWTSCKYQDLLSKDKTCNNMHLRGLKFCPDVSALNFVGWFLVGYRLVSYVFIEYKIAGNPWIL